MKINFYDRFSNRNKEKYCLDSIKYIFQTNLDLKISTAKLISDKSCSFNNIDVTKLSINETLDEVIRCILKKVKS